ncbi:Hypothetical_protein [Hexamita inflata]|uniref:Hypothetical_protein n=1 Tax=Hexamita inflata TaxID=28002 RepID=A0AA86R4H9_9EUKA|nr:Hypothetical protein HINF_LOCUS57995 [Hexamita inflata]
MKADCVCICCLAEGSWFINFGKTLHREFWLLLQRRFYHHRVGHAFELILGGLHLHLVLDAFVVRHQQLGEQIAALLFQLYTPSDRSWLQICKCVEFVLRGLLIQLPCVSSTSSRLFVSGFGPFLLGSLLLVKQPVAVASGARTYSARLPLLWPIALSTIMLQQN